MNNCSCIGKNSPGNLVWVLTRHSDEGENYVSGVFISIEKILEYVRVGYTEKDDNFQRVRLIHYPDRKHIVEFARWRNHPQDRWRRSSTIKYFYESFEVK